MSDKAGAVLTELIVASLPNRNASCRIYTLEIIFLAQGMQVVVGECLHIQSDQSINPTPEFVLLLPTPANQEPLSSPGKTMHAAHASDARLQGGYQQSMAATHLILEIV
jgi:hypothetical protein